MTIKKQPNKMLPIKKLCLLTSASVMNTRISLMQLTAYTKAYQQPIWFKTTNMVLVSVFIQPIQSKINQVLL